MMLLGRVGLVDVHRARDFEGCRLRIPRSEAAPADASSDRPKGVEKQRDVKGSASSRDKAKFEIEVGTEMGTERKAVEFRRKKKGATGITEFPSVGASLADTLINTV
jgi:hypothetical protein